MREKMIELLRNARAAEEARKRISDKTVIERSMRYVEECLEEAEKIASELGIECKLPEEFGYHTKEGTDTNYGKFIGFTQDGTALFQQDNGGVQFLGIPAFKSIQIK